VTFDADLLLFFNRRGSFGREDDVKITTNGPQSIGQVVRHYQLGNLFLSPVEYQRESAWDTDQKKLLIDTIFQRMDVPKFYLWKIDRKTLIDGYPRNEAHEL
jgi:hypothetical protein